MRATDYKDPPKVAVDIERVANLYEAGIDGYNRMNGLVCGIDGISQTVRANSGGHNEVKIAEPCIAAMRGRNPDNPTSRQSGLPTQQMLEIKEDGTSNTITTVQKDNMVIEPTFRIRKLTPRECWRLMGFYDTDFDKAQAVNSNSQLYKQAGNSIVVDVLMAIFKEML